MPNWKKKLFDPSTKKNGCEFQIFNIRPHSAVDSAQWDLGMTKGQQCLWICGKSGNTWNENETTDGSMC